MTKRRWWVIGLAGTASSIALVAAGLEVREGQSPWVEIQVAVVVPFLAWTTFRKLTSDCPVDEDWVTHIRFAGAGALATVWGLLEAADGGQAVMGRLVGVVAVVVGAVLLAAAERDYAVWRAAVDRERQEWAAEDDEQLRRGW